MDIRYQSNKLYGFDIRSTQINAFDICYSKKTEIIMVNIKRAIDV